MSLPQSVQAQAAAAAKHFDRAPENPEAEEEGKAPAPDSEQNPQDDTKQADTAKPEGAQSAEAPKDEPKPQTQDALYWQHRFQVLQGKYNGELPALRKENEQLKQQVADKDRRIQELEKQAPVTDNSGISDDQLAQFKESFGEDLVTFIERMSKQNAAAPETGNTKELQDRLDRLEAEKEADAAEKREDAEARFWSSLEQAVPSFRQINSDPAFLQFLSKFDPQTGRQYQQVLSEAQQSLNAKGVADIFKLHLSQATPKTPEKRTVPDEQVEPRTTKAAPTPSSQGGKLWTGAEISQFYRDKTAGRYAADEAQRLEADIFAAQREGRVR
ncbi:hypothetical protein J7J47_11895 [Halomonas sp. ISL-60]|uniref:hypothetical protein n=1 Tax=Halomonas sp. ISL-56 TaxID=2819149 RepID=UPI001BEA38AC|nr:hypothetical protein [Halomonas sp. ISL-56]MBT2772925.1 hypothetical protein [Halomonas sp. ISL-60]MBT2799972.1 hypothetical protein [Halomonas sp. ISL-56]